MARYYQISPLFWSDQKVQRWPENTRLLALYLLTCEHRNLEGYYRLPYAYIQADLEWSDGEVRERMATLLDDGFIQYDEAARVILLPNALKYHEPKSAKHIQGALNALQQVPDSELYPAFVEAAAMYAPSLYSALVGPEETLSEGFATEGIGHE